MEGASESAALSASPYAHPPVHNRTTPARLPRLPRALRRTSDTCPSPAAGAPGGNQAHCLAASFRTPHSPPCQPRSAPAPPPPPRCRPSASSRRSAPRTRRGPHLTSPPRAPSSRRARLTAVQWTVCSARTAPSATSPTPSPAPTRRLWAPPALVRRRRREG